MKCAKRRRPNGLKPRYPVAVNPILEKGGAHPRRDKKASRARLEARFLREPE